MVEPSDRHWWALPRQLMLWRPLRNCRRRAEA